MYDDLKNIRTDNKAIRDFGILIGFILLIIAGILFYKERESYELIILLGIAFIGLGLGMPIILKPFYSFFIFLDKFNTTSLKSDRGCNSRETHIIGVIISITISISIISIILCNHSIW